MPMMQQLTLGYRLQETRTTGDAMRLFADWLRLHGEEKLARELEEEIPLAGARGLKGMMLDAYMKGWREGSRDTRQRLAELEEGR